MRKYELVAPCHFGMEAVLKREIYDIGYDVTHVEDGRVTFKGDAEAVCRSNIYLRSAERILLKAGEFHAETFDELFEGIRKIPWEEYLPENARFWVAKASTVKSRLFSSSDIQSIVKKAIVERLRQTYHRGWFEEDGAAYPLRIFLKKDEVTAAIDTTGESLHKRGYRTMSNIAPISETLASALILLTPWHSDRILVDPFCGSGTIPIEAAMMAAHMAPGMRRNFTAESWTNLVFPSLWEEIREEAEDEVDTGIETDIQGYDIDDASVRVARENARRAGVENMIHFQRRAVCDLHHPKKYGFLITNPPYGERMEDKEALPELYTQLGNAFRGLDSWSAYVITAYEDAERYIGRKADKKRKIYNGMIRTCYYQFLGPKPPKRKIQKEEQGAGQQ